MASVEVLDVVCYDSVVREHHIYKTIWTPFIGEILTVNREEDNSYDSCAVAVRWDDCIVGIYHEKSRGFFCYMVET